MGQIVSQLAKENQDKAAKDTKRKESIKYDRIKEMTD